MKATEAKLLEFLRKSPQFVIPIYQRTYSWTLKECQQRAITSTGPESTNVRPARAASTGPMPSRRATRNVRQ